MQESNTLITIILIGILLNTCSISNRAKSISNYVKDNKLEERVKNLEQQFKKNN